MSDILSVKGYREYLSRMFCWCNVVRGKKIGTVAGFASNYKADKNSMRKAEMSLSLADKIPPSVSWEAHRIGESVIAVH